mgnify:CR=1 FL=1
MNLLHKIYQQYKENPEKIALIKDDIKITYSEFFTKIVNIAEFWLKKGIKYQDKIVLCSNKELEFIYCYYASKLLGLIVVPLDPLASEEKKENLLESIKPFLYYDFSKDKNIKHSTNLNSQNSIEQFISKLYKAEENSYSEIVFTSGTTGNPKGVVLTLRNLKKAIENINTVISISEEDVEMLVMPLNHSFALARMRCILDAGGTMVLIDGLKSPKAFFKALEKENISVIGMVPAAWNLLWKLSKDHIKKYSNQIKYIEIGSAPMSLAEKMKIINILPNTNIFIHYGLTEASRCIFNELSKKNKSLALLGQSAPNVNIKIYNKDGKELGLNEIGEICVRGEMISEILYQNGEFIQNESFYGKYLRTSDVGSMNKEGFVTLFARDDDIINIGGKKVSPIEVEQVLNELVFIEECACIGAKDTILGEKIVAFLVLNRDVEIKGNFEGKVINEIKNKFETYKIPSEFKIINSIPKTLTGKILRNDLRVLYKNAANL